MVDSNEWCIRKSCCIFEKSNPCTTLDSRIIFVRMSTSAVKIFMLEYFSTFPLVTLYSTFSVYLFTFLQMGYFYFLGLLSLSYFLIILLTSLTKAAPDRASRVPNYDECCVNVHTYRASVFLRPWKCSVRRRFHDDLKVFFCIFLIYIFLLTNFINCCPTLSFSTAITSIFLRNHINSN